MAATIRFEDIRFTKRDAQTVRCMFLGRYYFDLTTEELERIGPFHIEEGAIQFPSTEEGHAWKQFDRLLSDAFTRLRHILYNKPTIYIHQNSGIPLIGTNEFGLVDRGTNIIEVKPLTGCNFQCPYCSVDEGKNDKTHDYIVECEYLVQEAASLAARKQHPVEYHIGPQGEPLLYPKFVELVRGLHAIPRTRAIAVVTNGSMLTEKLIDQLADAGLTKIHLSLNAMSQETADAMSGRTYPLQHVLRMIAYCKGKIHVIIAPTIVQGWNDKELGPLVAFGKTLPTGAYPTIGMQNFLHYPRGRNPAGERSWEEFSAMLAAQEQEHGVRLQGFTNEDVQIHEDDELPKPFRKDQVVKARIALPARFPGEIIGVAQERCITISGPGADRLPIGREVKVRLVRDKHNIYKGVLT